MIKKERRLLISVCVAGVAAALAGAVLFLWRCGEAVDGGRLAQARALAPAGRAAGAAGDATNTNAAGRKPERAAVTERTVQDAEEERRLSAARQFLLYAERNSAEARQRIEVLHTLKLLFEGRYGLRPTAPSEVLNNAEKAARAIQSSRKRMEESRRELYMAIADLTSLTPEARQQWEEQEAKGWSGPTPPIEILANGERLADPFAERPDEDFLTKRGAITDPLIEEWERLDSLVDELKVEARKQGTAAAKAAAELARTRKESGRVKGEMEAAMLETVRLKEDWERKNWERYEKR